MALTLASAFAPVTRFMAAVRARLAAPFSRYYARSSTGVFVNHASAEQNAAVWACMDVIASALSASDWNVYAGTRAAADKKDLPADSLQYILNTRFNAEMTAQAGKRAIALAAVGYGTGYAEIEYDMARRIVALWPISPDRVSPRRDETTGRLFYLVWQEGVGDWVEFEPDQLFIVRGASLLGFAGDDAINRAVKSIGMALALDQYAAGFFANGAQLGTVFTYKGKLDDPHYNRVKEQIDQRHAGVNNAFRSGFFEGDGEWNVHAMGIDAEKAQLVPAKHLSVEEICRWFRVPPHKVAHLLRATNNNIEHQGLEFTRDTLRPWVKEIEQEADYKLIPARGPRKFVEIDTDWAEQGDYKSRAEAYQILRAAGVFNANMILRKLGENTIGPKGEVFTMNGAAVRLEDVGKNMLPAPAQTSAPAPAPNKPDDDPAVTAAWLLSVYQRIEARVENRAERLRSAGRPDWQAEARASSRRYALEQVAELADHLGACFINANDQALQVVEGADPRAAVQAALELDATLEATP